MRFPAWLLRLLPIWDYICPKCRKEVEKNTRKCPYCREHYEQPLRVPPTILKDKERLEEYVHKHIFPRISKEQRDYLAQWFTEFFNDGFEDGFSAWTGTVNTPTTETDNPHHGTYNAEGTRNSEGNGPYCYVTFSGESVTFTRAYYKFLDLNLLSNGYLIDLLTLDNGAWQWEVVGAVQNFSGTLKWAMLVVENSTIYTVEGTNTPVEDTWYCLEIERDVTNNEQKFWVDGNLEASASYSITNDTTRALHGITYLNSTNNNTVVWDCVIVADAYIGPEEGTTSYTKTWATDALLKKLGITKTLSADADFQKQDIPKTFGLDSTFQKSVTFQKQIDTLFKKLGILETFGIDVDFLKRNLITSFAVDVRFSALMTQTISKQIDVLLKKQDATKTFGVDIYFGATQAETYTKDFALDVIFAYKMRLPELWLDENGKLVMNISKPYAWVGT